MTKKLTTLLLLGATAITLASCSKVESADRVVYGNIYTSNVNNKKAEAVAIKDGKIIFVGSKADAKKYEGSNTKVDTFSSEKLVTAGLVDGHTHVQTLMAAQFESLGHISQGAKKAQAVKDIEDYVKDNPTLNFYTLTGWEMQNFSDEEYKCPTAAMIDHITDKPIVAFSSDGHSYWCNTVAMNKAGVTKDTVSPDGGVILKDKSGNPLGIFNDTAEYIIDNIRPEKSREVYTQGIEAADLFCLAEGYVSRFQAFDNAAYNAWKYPQVTYMEELDKAGQLRAYSQGSFLINNTDDAYELVDAAINLRDSTKGGNYEITNVKIFLDGIVENAGAYLVEPYANDPTNRGSQRWKGSNAILKMGHIIAKANKAGMAVHFHGMGDQAICDILDAIQYAANEVGIETVRNARNAVAHLALVRNEDFARFADYGVIAVFNPWCNKDPGYFDLQVGLLGEERANKQYPMKSFLNAGARYSFGTDLGASFTFDTIECFHALTTRKYNTHAPESLLNEAEKLSREETLMAMTMGGAYQLKKEDTFGSLEVGKDASLCVFSQDLLTIADDKIMSTKLEDSMFKGVWTSSIN